MTTTTRVLDANVNGTVYTANANSALEALDTCHSGTTPPTDEVANGKFWLDTTTTPSILKMYDNATWNVVVNATNVTDAGAVMDSELTDIAAVKALNQGVATSDSPTFAALSDGTDTVETSYVINGSAKAWINFNGTGTAAIRDSMNVTSLTDIGVGLYNTNLTGNMSSADYASTTGSTRATSISADRAASGQHKVGSCLLNNRNLNSNAEADDDELSLVLIGDLA